MCEGCVHVRVCVLFVHVAYMCELDTACVCC